VHLRYHATLTAALLFPLTGAQSQEAAPPTIVLAPPVKPSPPAPPRVEHCDGPEYPNAAKRAEVQGTTRVRLRLDALGNVTEAEVISTSGESREHKFLDHVTREAFKKCKFEPGNAGRVAILDYVFSLNFEDSSPGLHGQTVRVMPPPHHHTGKGVLRTGSCPLPTYPEASLKLGQTGTGRIKVELAPNTRVLSSGIVVSSGVPELDSAALAVIPRCTYTPSFQGGQAVKDFIIVEFVWKTDPAPTVEFDSK